MYSSRVTQRACDVPRRPRARRVVTATPLNAHHERRGNGPRLGARGIFEFAYFDADFLFGFAPACVLRFSPASTNPAETEYRPLLRHALLCCSSRRSSWSTIAVITAGSIREQQTIAILIVRAVLSPAAKRRFDGRAHVGQ